MMKVQSNKLKDDPNAERKEVAKKGRISLKNLRVSNHAMMGVYYKEKILERQKIEI